MLIFIGKRLIYMLLTMFAISLILFLVMEINGEAVARRVLGPFTSAEQIQAWLQANGYLRPWYVRYVEWLGNVLSGDFGQRSEERRVGKECRCRGAAEVLKEKEG